MDGRNREVRVLSKAAGVDVKKLKRVRVGGLRMPSELPIGKYMSLKPHQVGLHTLNPDASCIVSHRITILPFCGCVVRAFCVSDVVCDGPQRCLLHAEPMGGEWCELRSACDTDSGSVLVNPLEPIK